MIPNILSIAGSDPSGGAGIQADIKAISANGGYALAAITALTVQNSQGVWDVKGVDANFVARQIKAILSDIRVDAIKIGMLGSAAVASAVAEILEQVDIPVVLDPVLAATSGASLLSAGGQSALLRDLVPRATIMTPNLPEAAAILATAEARDRSEMERQARDLAGGGGAVLLKGGHLPGADSPDVLVVGGEAFWFETPRLKARNTHGTGCTLSSALACQLAFNTGMKSAVEAAKTYTMRAIRSADLLDVGHGRGPLHHFHAQV